MNKKLFYVSVFLVLALFLSGCSSNLPTIPGTSTEETKIKTVVNEYYLALSNMDWNKAKGYCIPGSEPYYAISQVEALINNYSIYCNVIAFNALISIQDVSINGNYSMVTGYVTALATACGYVIYNSEGYSYIYLQKVGNTWKIYNLD